jgi:two-component system response regulator DesR
LVHKQSNGQSNVHVVIAIGNPSLRLALELLLSEEPGVEVVGTTSETEGLLALVRTAQPDLVVLDWQLPGRPISDLLSLLQSAEERPKLIVLNGDARVRQRALRAGADAFVTVGDSPNHLLDVFRGLREGEIEVDQ